MRIKQALCIGVLLFSSACRVFSPADVNLCEQDLPMPKISQDTYTACTQTLKNHNNQPRTLNQDSLKTECRRMRSVVTSSYTTPNTPLTHELVCRLVCRCERENSVRWESLDQNIQISPQLAAQCSSIQEPFFTACTVGIRAGFYSLSQTGNWLRTEDMVQGSARAQVNSSALVRDCLESCDDH